MSPILSENLVKWQRVIFLSEKIRQIKVAQKTDTQNYGET